MYEEFQNTHFYLVSLFFEKYLEKSVKLNVIILQFSLFLKRPGYFYFVLYVTRVEGAHGLHKRAAGGTREGISLQPLPVPAAQGGDGQPAEPH